jgi:hypothetical protein
VKLQSVPPSPSTRQYDCRGPGAATAPSVAIELTAANATAESIVLKIACISLPSGLAGDPPRSSVAGSRDLKLRGGRSFGCDRDALVFCDGINSNRRTAGGDSNASTHRSPWTKKRTDGNQAIGPASAHKRTGPGEEYLCSRHRDDHGGMTISDA